MLEVKAYSKNPKQNRAPGSGVDSVQNNMFLIYQNGENKAAGKKVPMSKVSAIPEFTPKSQYNPYMSPNERMISQMQDPNNYFDHNRHNQVSMSIDFISKFATFINPSSPKTVPKFEPKTY